MILRTVRQPGQRGSCRKLMMIYSAIISFARKPMDLSAMFFSRYTKPVILMITLTVILISVFAQFPFPVFPPHHEGTAFVTLDVCRQGSAFSIGTNSPALAESFFLTGFYHNYYFILNCSNQSVSSVFLSLGEKPPEA